MEKRGLSRDNSLLLVVDVQGKLALSMYNLNFLLANLKRLIRAAPELMIPTAVLEQTPEKLGRTLPALAEELQQDVPIFSKHTFSGGGQPAFMEHVEKLRKSDIVVAGIECHVCVYQTVRDLCLAGYGVRVVADAVSSRTKSNLGFGLEMCRDAGGKITTTEAVLFDWMESTDHPAFRAVLQSVR